MEIICFNLYTQSHPSKLFVSSWCVISQLPREKHVQICHTFRPTSLLSPSLYLSSQSLLCSSKNIYLFYAYVVFWLFVLESTYQEKTAELGLPTERGISTFTHCPVNDVTLLFVPEHYSLCITFPLFICWRTLRLVPYFSSCGFRFLKT